MATTTDELMARLNKKWNDDVKALDTVYDHILRMADALTDGIVKQFPDKFSARPSALVPFRTGSSTHHACFEKKFAQIRAD